MFKLLQNSFFYNNSAVGSNPNLLNNYIAYKKSYSLTKHAPITASKQSARFFAANLFV